MNRFIILGLMFSTFIYSQKTALKMNDVKLVQPRYLQKGDTVIIVAPAGTLKGKNEIIEKGVSLMESWGLIVKKGTHLFDDFHHFSASDKNRITDFQKALDDPSIKAIWCARGGYGTTRIIDDLDFSKFKKNPKWVIGYSDVTALHSHIHNLGIETLHAMMPIDFRHPEEEIETSIKTLKKALFGNLERYEMVSSKHNQKGECSGQLVGGNLTLLQNVIGSKTHINTKNKIIFIEEIGEYKYHIDRMLYSLKRAGFFDNCKGVIIGEINKVKKNNPAFGKSVENLILNIFKNKDIPILFHFPAGHGITNTALIMGRTVTLKVNKKTPSSLTFK